MTTTMLTITCGALLLAGTALAAPTAQQLCDYQRLTVWKKFETCMDAVLAKNAKGVEFDEFAARASSPLKNISSG